MDTLVDAVREQAVEIQELDNLTDEHFEVSGETHIDRDSILAVLQGLMDKIQEEMNKIQEENYWNMTHEELEEELAKDIQQFLDEQEEE